MSTRSRILAAAAAVIFLFLSPLASAEPLHEVDVDPPPGWGDGYYLRASVLEPEAPREATPEDDCSPYRPSGVVTSAFPIVKPLDRLPDPTAFRGVSDWTPRCVAVTVSASDAYQLCRFLGGACFRAAPPETPTPYVSWTVTDGRVYTDADHQDLPPFVLRVPLALSADCEDCPPGNVLQP